ncbi:sensor histidine kinase [Clostridium thermarum]|uniref:sensor histidine kinase n=1 Tax=Clostridium thermarum TaxID=1716543 RepID=UPI0011240049|nr:HAMP domain-containing sensor histidine kinase [Clostridium thermarum]
MSIKLRLVLSYIAMLIIPIVTTVLIAHFSILYYFSDMQKGENEISYAPIRDALEEREELFIKIKEISLKTPEKLFNESYIKELEGELKKLNSGIIVRKNDDVVYVTPKYEGMEMESILPDFGEYKEDIPFRFKGAKIKLILSQQDFYFSDRSEGSVFLLTDIQPLIKIFKRLSVTVAVTIIIVLILTNGFLTYIVAKRIVNPLNKLKESANKIKDGDLDFNVDIDSDDEIGELGIAFNDMRVRLKSSLELQQQYENNRKELISNISHDLRTPITSIKGYVEGIRDGVADTPEKMNKYINTIYKKAVAADKLIDELFLYSKLDLSKLEFNFNDINIVKYLIDCMEELQFDLEKRGMTISFNGSDYKDIIVRVDVQQLKRVIINIVENAVKYMDKANGKIQVSLQEEEDEVIIAFADNGQGIEKEALPYIFDRFYRADLSRNSATGGSGLGLSIAKMIIEEHGGRMWAESVEGEGTSVYFTLKKSKSGETV